MKTHCLIFVLMLAGCSSFSSETSDAFDRGAVAQDAFEQDSAKCETLGEERRSMDGMGGLAGVAQHYESFNRVYDACMRGRGYKHKR